MSLLEQDSIKKRRVNKLLELKSEFSIREDRKYKIETSKDSAIYAKSVEGQLLGLY